MTGSLGRRTPRDFTHVTKYPYSAVAPTTVAIAERRLALPTQYRDFYNQGSEGACVGFSSSWMMSTLNRRKYDARKLYQEAQRIDEWSDTPPAEGTSVRAGMDVLRTVGHWRFFRGLQKIAGVMEGISANRWATSVDDVRTAIQCGTPVVFGVNWYSSFDHPVLKGVGDEPGRPEYWVGTHAYIGYIRGGHAICAYAVSDKRQAVRWVNSWGQEYPRVWVPYDMIERLIREDGEVALVTDR